MKVVVAMNAFKSSTNAFDMGNACKEGICRVYKDANVVVSPVADGGDGTVEALVYGMNARVIDDIEVTGPMGDKVKAKYAVVDKEKIAIMEMNAAAGIKYVKKEDRNPLIATTYGVGEMIKDAIDRGYTKIFMGIGGSATNEGGIGMMQALGYKMLDKDGNDVVFGARGVRDVVKIDTSTAYEKLKGVEFTILTDVTNPMCGENGASYCYSRQKGGTDETIPLMDEWLKKYGELVNSVGKKISLDYPGLGSCGGIALPLMSFCEAKMTMGGPAVIELIKLEDKIKDADIVVTGEGQIDWQTANGKAPMQVATLAKKYNKVVIDISGRIGEGANCNIEKGIDAYFSIIQTIDTKENFKDAGNAQNNMANITEQIFRVIKATRGISD